VIERGGVHAVGQVADTLGQVPEVVAGLLGLGEQHGVLRALLEGIMHPVQALAQQSDLLAHVVVQFARHPAALLLESRHLPRRIIPGRCRDSPLRNNHGGTGGDHEDDGHRGGGEVEGQECGGLSGHRIPW